MHRVIGISLLGLGLGACGGRAFVPDDAAAIRAVLAEQSAAWNSGDLEGFMDSGYAHGPELVFTAGGAVRRGYDATLARYKQRYATRERMGRLAFEDIEITPLGADGAVVLGHWSLSDTPKASEGVFSLGFLRTAAGWRIVHDHTSVGPESRRSRVTAARSSQE